MAALSSWIEFSQAMVRLRLGKIVENRPLADVIPSPEDIVAFEHRWNVDDGESVGPSCSLSSFKLDLVGTPHSPWNLSAFRVFYPYFLNAQGLPPSDNLYNDTYHYFFTRVRGLKTIYEQSFDLQEERALRRRAKRRWQRKRTVCSSLEAVRALMVLSQTFQRRLHIATIDPLLGKHVHILQRLGVEGMSSDESDVEELRRDPAVRRRQPSYFVSTPAWRHPTLTAWLLAFDSMHVISRRTAGKRLRGAYPRCRIYARDRSSKSKRYVSHLPKTAYNPDWLKTRHNIEFTVAPTEENYSFTHDDHVDMYVICSRP
jgi:hypothetical protein